MEVLRLMGHCSNRCIFCMVREEIEAGEDIPFVILKGRLDQLPKGTAVDLFGGEPTLYPGFFQLLEYLCDKGLPFQIASNGKRFKKRQFAERVARFKPVQVRTSLYGADAQSHDFLTQTRGSFEDTLLGIRNMNDIGIPVSVNYLIFQRNVKQIFEATKRLTDLGVCSFKYSLPIMTDSYEYLLADIGSVRRSLIPTLHYLNSLGLMFVIEKAPFCLAPEYVKNYFMESSPEMIQSLPDIFVKMRVCSKCLLETYCLGIDSGYFKRYAEADVHALNWNDLPRDLVRNVSWDQLMNAEINSGFALFHLTDEETLLEPGNLERFLRLSDEKQRHGSLIGLI